MQPQHAALSALLNGERENERTRVNESTDHYTAEFKTLTNSLAEWVRGVQIQQVIGLVGRALNA